MFGLFLVVLGVYFLFKEMGLISGDFWGYFWPVLFIALGFKMMLKEKHKGHNNCFSFWCGNHKKHHDKHKHDKVVDNQ